MFPGATKLEDCTKSESTISRYACRITVERELGVDYNGDQIFKPRIYAAGFDSNRSIQLGVILNIYVDSVRYVQYTSTLTSDVLHSIFLLPQV